MTVTGVVHSVGPQWQGSSLTADAAASAVVLPVTNAGDFEDFTEGPPPQPRFLTIGEDLTPREYIDSQQDDDYPQTLTLAEPLGVGFETGLPVYLWDPASTAPDKRAVQFRALVVLDDQPDGNPIRASIDLEKVPVAEAYALEGARVSLVDDDDDGEWWVDRIRGRSPVLDPGTLDRGRLTEIIIEDAPGSSVPPPPPAPVTPLVSVTGLPRGYMVQITNGLPGWSYTYKVTPSNGAEQSYPTTTRPLLYSETLPDGSPFDPTLDGYSWSVTATNESGSASSLSSATLPLVLNDSATIAELAVGKLIAGDLVGAFALIGALQVGASISIDDENGIVISQPAGGEIRFPADGTAASISAHLDAFSLTVRDRLVIRGLVNEIAAGSEVVMAAGVSTPSQPPSVSLGWTPKPLRFAPGFENTLRGLARLNATTWVSGSSFFGGSLRAADDTGFAVTYDLGSRIEPLGGVTVIGTVVFALIRDRGRNDRWFVRRYDSTNAMALLGEWEYTGNPTSTYRPALGRTESGNVLIAHAQGNNDLVRIFQFTPTGTDVNNVATDFAVGADLSGIAMGTYDMGVTRYVFTTRSRVYATTTSGARTTAQEWTKAPGAIVGLAWDATNARFVHLDDDSTRWEYGKLVTDTPRTPAYAWFDSDAAGTGQHETNRLEGQPFVQKARALMVITCPTPNDTGGADDPDSVRHWINGQRQPDLGFVNGAPVLSRAYDQPSTGTTTKAPAFPVVATSGRFRSAATREVGGGYVVDLRGGGPGNVGPLSWDAVGTRTDPHPRGGTVAVGVAGNNPVTASQRVQFGFTYPTPPAVVANVVGTAPDNTRTTVAAIDTTGFTVYVTRINGGATSIGVSWTAVPA